METIMSKELAKAMNVDAAYVHRLMKWEMIPHIIVGGRRYPLADALVTDETPYPAWVFIDRARRYVGYTVKDAMRWIARAHQAVNWDGAWYITRDEMLEEKKRVDAKKLVKYRK